MKEKTKKAVEAGIRSSPPTLAIRMKTPSGEILEWDREAKKWVPSKEESPLSSAENVSRQENTL